MQVSFGKTAYVSGTSDAILDKLENSPLSISLTGEGTVVVTRESVEEFLNNYKENMEAHERARLRSIKEFLESSLQAIDTASDGVMPIGDIFFTT